MNQLSGYSVICKYALLQWRAGGHRRDVKAAAWEHFSGHFNKFLRRCSTASHTFLQIPKVQTYLSTPGQWAQEEKTSRIPPTMSKGLSPFLRAHWSLIQLHFLGGKKASSHGKTCLSTSSLMLFVSLWQIQHYRLHNLSVIMAPNCSPEHKINERRDPNRVNTTIYRAHWTGNCLAECSLAKSVCSLVAALASFGPVAWFALIIWEPSAGLSGWGNGCYGPQSQGVYKSTIRTLCINKSLFLFFFPSL
jgi:hypothetical protein